MSGRGEKTKLATREREESLAPRPNSTKRKKEWGGKPETGRNVARTDRGASGNREKRGGCQ